MEWKAKQTGNRIAIESVVCYARQEEARAPLEISFATNWLVVLKTEF
jgi:hypothetical protein